MDKYAISEIWELMNSIRPEEINSENPKLQYICALLAELAYYHVPEFELEDDNRKRAMLIPCEEFRKFAARGIRIDLTKLRQLGDLNIFVEETDMVVAIGLRLRDVLFIAYRGTIGLFSSDMVTNIAFWHSQGLHRGFAKEADRISLKLQKSILEKFDSTRNNTIEHIFFTGHSLGAAIAAISEQRLEIVQSTAPQRHSIIFGSPRYCADYKNLVSINPPIGPLQPPTPFRRIGDLVPTVPPEWAGYSSPPEEFNPKDGMPYNKATRKRWNLRAPHLRGSLDWAIFALRRFKPHGIRNYRRELGLLVNAKFALSDLAPWNKL